ncbi:MAG: LysM peptidoglycan-binding domain-containing protein [Candidatus Aceula lacicola]|nr:LysM peptidoglycan-binding domain-containing protein [Candidatus Aceula lacicola]
MARRIIGIIGVVLLAFVVTSCTVKRYVQEKSRVDQEMVGNEGCFQGECELIDRSGIRKTRKTYVLEIIKNPKNAGIQEDVPEDFYSEGYVEDAGDAVVESEDVVIYDAEESSEPAVEVEIVYVDYTIAEGDTLQKISKKFYDTYKRWYEIYEVNKDVLPNADRLKPGKVIKIPQIK